MTPAQRDRYLTELERRVDAYLRPPGPPPGIPVVTQAQFAEMSCAERVENYRRMIRNEIWFEPKLPRPTRCRVTISREEFDRMTAAERVQAYRDMLGGTKLIELVADAEPPTTYVGEHRRP